MSLPSSFDVKTEGEKTTDEMTVGEKVLFYCKQQPLVPLGCLLTTGAVVMAAMSVKQGNKEESSVLLPLACGFPDSYVGCFSCWFVYIR